MAYERLSAVIADLSNSKSDEDQKKTKALLEQRFQNCETRLTQEVKYNRDNFYNVLELSSSSIHTIAVSKRRCQFLKERLISCKEMLQCKRDELRRLWLDSLQHKYAHDMLQEIKKLRKIPQSVNSNLIDRKFLHATEVLVSSLELLGGKLSSTEALKDLKSELYNLQENLYCQLLDELHEELFMFDSFIRKVGEDCLKDASYEEVFDNGLSDNKPQAIRKSLSQIDFNNLHVSLLLHCITMLNKLPETLDILKERSQKELMSIVKKASKLMYDVLQKSIDQHIFDLPSQQQHLFLLDLLETILDIFRQVALNHRIFLKILRTIIEKKGLTDLTYHMDDIYSKVQATIEHFVGYYLELGSSSTSSSQEVSLFSNSQNMSDVAGFFLPSSYSQGKQQSLFKFRNSCHGMNMKKYSQEIKESPTASNSVKPDLICKPAVRNIIFIFNPLKNFVSEIESSLMLDPGTHCPLYAFIFDSANIFLDQVNSEVNKMLENASTNLEAWNVSVVNSATGCKTTMEKHILTSTVILNNNLKELQGLINYLPDYSNHFLHLMYYVILDYKGLFYRAFKNLFEEEQNILSVSWAKDRDIRRLLKSFSNWRYLEDNDCTDAIESPEEIRLRNKEESELLIRNLHSEDHSSWEIINDSIKLSNLALLQESLHWFSVELMHLIKHFSNAQASPPYEEYEGNNSKTDQQSYSPNAAMGLKKLAKEYEEFADICLLVLHLEVRAHCFHHLLPFADPDRSIEGSFSHDLDMAVKKLTADLIQMDELLLPVLTTKEIKYVFEGLGELVSSIVIHNISNMNKINDSLVQQMYRHIFVIQCCLANITMTREVSLERARQYIDLLTLSHEELFNQIVEEGPKFKEPEYSSIIRLLSSKSEEFNPQVLDYYQNKLNRIFEKIFSAVST